MTRNAIVTGARSGIGKALVAELAKQRINVWAIVHRDDDDYKSFTESLQHKYNVWIRIVYVDLSKEDEIKSAVKGIIQEKKSIDILINAAGAVSSNRLIQMTSITDMRYIIDVNFFAPIILSQLISRVMCRQKDGVIINITSASVWNVDLAQLEYIASKAALDAATRKMAKEWGQYNVRVNAIAPGLTNTKMLDHMEESLKSMIVNSTSLKRLGEIDDVVNLCMFLIDEKSKYITGQTYRIDGGM